MKSFLGNFYRHLAIFFLVTLVVSECPQVIEAVRPWYDLIINYVDAATLTMFRQDSQSFADRDVMGHFSENQFKL